METYPFSKNNWNLLDNLIEQNDPYCRGVVILGLGADKQKLNIGFKQASTSKYVKGFAVGRTIFAKPSNKWLNKDIDDRTLIKKVKENYREIIQMWNKR